MDTPTRTVRVPLGDRSYDAIIGHGLLPGLGGRVASLSGGGRSERAFVVYDEGLSRELVNTVIASLAGAGFDTSAAGIAPSEEAKSLGTAERLLAEIALTRHERDDPVVALGGGIVGDLAGFAASVYRRGVPVVQCPTTLLAMVDASVGGKTGVNLRIGADPGSLKKNVVGAFHQPRLVVADVGALASLPARHLRSGLAECVKHALIGADWGEPGLFEWISTRYAGVLAGDLGTLIELVARNVAVKAGVIAGDEEERAEAGAGARALLNLGHTFGHAIETLPGLSPDGQSASAPLQHGEAVGLGLVAACRCAHDLGICPGSVGDRVVDLLGRIGLPTRVAGLPANDRLLAAMSHDKKVSGDKLRLVLPIELGRSRVIEDPGEGAICAGIDAIRGETM